MSRVARDDTRVKRNSGAKQSTKKRKKDLKVKKPNLDKNGLLSDARKMIEGVDLVVLFTVLVLAVFGILMVFSAGYYTTVNVSSDALYYLKKQGFWVVTGFAWLFIFANIDYHRFNKYANSLMLLSIVLLVLVLLVGQNVNGATRWLGVGSFRITPSELSKLFMIIFTSVYLAKDPDNIRTAKGLGVLGVVMIIHLGLIIKQPNLSTAIVVAAIMVAIMMVAGLHWMWFVLFGGVGVAGIFLILTRFQDSHWYSRLTNWIDPFADAQGEGYQVSQSIIALGNGGLKGLGFGNSISKNLYLPEPQNDFILAVIGEEFGYIGFVILMAVYMFLLYRLIMIALKAKDRLGFYLATGVAVMLGLQVIINVAVVTASMPATGITLPFISYGGTSMWAFMVAMGIALNVSRRGKKVKR